MGDIVGAFNEQHAAILTGVSRRQLRAWDRYGVLKPGLSSDERGFPNARMYSFKDLVALRVLNRLRNATDSEVTVSGQHLREVAAKLAHLGDDRWTKVTLYVGPNRKLIWHEPGTDLPQEIATGQYVLKLPMAVEVEDMRETLRQANVRTPDEIGRIVQTRGVLRNRKRFAGTRIPVSAVLNFHQAGYSPEEIVKAYPRLTVADVLAVIPHNRDAAAA